MCRDVKEIRVLDDSGNTMFANGEVIYEIPIYQRAFAWGTESGGDINRVDEVCQLMDDVCNFDGATYYIGSMVVRRMDGNDSDRREAYEVVDGQQRLTALYVILSCLNWQLEEKIITVFNHLKMAQVLKYSNREKSRQAIMHLDEVIKFLQGKSDKIKIEKKEVDNKKEEQWLTDSGVCLESSICDAAYRVLKKIEGEDANYLLKLLDRLQRVKLYRIEVPEDTDLNLYFEIMNVRGEQLEQTDIVKARLMQVLDSDARREWFAKTWNASRDMTGYVQMNFSNARNRERSKLFGEDWTGLPGPEQFEPLLIECEASSGEDDDVNATMLSAVLNPKAGFEFGKTDQNVDPEENSRFRSVIYFQHFLLHVLRIYRKTLEKGELATGPLKEKDIAGEFEKALPKEKDKQSDWVWGFMICLLRCRCLFDRYFIKRDYIDDDVGEWSVKSLGKTGEKSWQYSETGGKTPENERCMMIESCLRVTYTEHKTMHWITHLLDWIYCKFKCGNAPTIADVAGECENFAREEVRKYLRSMEENSYRMGTRTPRLLFNYLDYLLWRNPDPKIGNADFAFEYRNSVEHWYPQHPNPEILAPWEDVYGERLDRDGFGNLCLIHEGENSRFSNLPPVSKATYSPEMNQHGSLKYRLMVAEIERLRGRPGDVNEMWKAVSFEHCQKMLELLAADVNFELNSAKNEYVGQN